MGIPGKLKTLTDRLTSTWAAKLDTLHDSRITSARAGYLDKLNITGVVPSANDYTATRAGYIDKLNITGVVSREDTPLLDIPIASGLMATSANIIGGSVGGFAIGVTATTLAATTSNQDIINYTGQGVLQLVAVNVTAAVAVTVDVIIDGVTVGTATTGAASLSAVCPVGAMTVTADFQAIALDSVPFKTSLQVRIRAASSTTANYAFKYRKTA